MLSREEVLDGCRERLAALIECQPADIAESSSFADLGLDSAMAVHFVLEVEDWLGVELYPEVTGDYPTLSAFCDYVRGLSA